jgi:hypothetical protein
MTHTTPEHLRNAHFTTDELINALEAARDRITELEAELGMTRIQKLFDLQTSRPVAARAHYNLQSAPAVSTSMPLVLKGKGVPESTFMVHGLRVGRVAVVLENRSYTFEELESSDNWRPELLLVGSSLSIELENLSEQDLGFSCEVWGLRKVPRARWDPMSLDLVSRATGSLALVRCSVCGHVLDLRVGSIIPGWCSVCLEEPRLLYERRDGR